ncbi:MAG: sugar phosphate isomerase/epimerase [Lentisphaerae bacterium]|nr:sugar phosphate isomerase/epimerase [Lentisphaerota bacterium]
MIFSLSTRWNTVRHDSAEPAIEEILDLGFKNIELGYDLPIHFVPDIKRLIENQTIAVTSVHNFCPIPIGAPQGHPELFVLTDTNANARQSAVQHTIRTIEFASEVGASCVVVHAGRVNLKNMTSKLIALAEAGKQYTDHFEKLKTKLLILRDKKAKKNLDSLYKGLEQLLPVCEQFKVKIALENLPSWEAVPTETEMEQLIERFRSPMLGYWHDFGHGQVRQNLGFIGHKRWFDKLLPYLAGTHIHDVIPPAHDHVMPPKGKICFSLFNNAVKSDIPLVFEPAPGTAADDIRVGLAHVRKEWSVKSINDSGE